MRILTFSVLALAMSIAPSLHAQEQSGDATPRQAQKAACQQEANLIYRTSSKGIGMAEDTRNEIIAARRAHVRDCMAKAGLAPG
jgi:hypothetical protein